MSKLDAHFAALHAAIANMQPPQVHVHVHTGDAPVADVQPLVGAPKRQISPEQRDKLRALLAKARTAKSTKAILAKQPVRSTAPKQYPHPHVS